MKMVKEIIKQQEVLKEWFQHANRQCEIKEEYREGFRLEFEKLMEDGNKLAQMPKTDRLDLLCDITDGSPQNEVLATELKEKGLIHLDDSDINQKLRFFDSLLDDKIISSKEHSEAYHLAHILNWGMESNAIAGKQALIGAGYYNNTQQDSSITEEQQKKNEVIPLYQNDSCISAEDFLLRTFFGTHLTDFLNESSLCKNGTGVAALVNEYINKYNLDKDKRNRNKPLHDALFAKGIIKIKISAWNDAIK